MHVEYQVESCSDTGSTNDGCVDTKRVSLSIPTGGTVVYGVVHQHTCGSGSTLYGETSYMHFKPICGDGKEAGNEAGYIVGMSTCYPNPESVTISDVETLVMKSHYNATKRHTGVMGLFYALADAPPKASSLPNAVTHKPMAQPIALWVVAWVGVAITIVVSLAYRKKREQEDVYEPIVM